MARSEFAGGGEDFHLMTGAAVADENGAVRAEGDLLRIFQGAVDENFRRGELHGFGERGERIAMQLASGEDEQAAFGIEGQAARVLQRDFGDDLLLRDIQEDELIELHHAEDEDAIADGDAAEVLAPRCLRGVPCVLSTFGEKVYLMIGLLPCAVMVVRAVMRISPRLSFAFFGAESSPQAAPA